MATGARAGRVSVRACIDCGEPTNGLRCERCRVPKRERKPRRGLAPHVAAPDLFPRYCTEHGLPEPVAEHRFCADRRWRFDYAWPEHTLALEVEGGIWTRGRHVRPRGYAGDMAKYNRAAAEGWVVLRVLPGELCTQATLDLVRTCMERAACSSRAGRQRPAAVKPTTPITRTSEDPNDGRGEAAEAAGAVSGAHRQRTLGGEAR